MRKRKTHLWLTTIDFTEKGNFFSKLFGNEGIGGKRLTAYSNSVLPALSRMVTERNVELSYSLNSFMLLFCTVLMLPKV